MVILSSVGIMVAIRTSELAAIFVATFENVRGTVIAYQYPPDYVSSTQFKEISNVVLPRAELAFHLITIEAFRHYVVGCPQRIEGDQYLRNTLQFNVCLVLKPKPCSVLDDLTHWHFWNDQSAGGLRLPIQSAYEALVLKINRFFYTLEVECAYVSASLKNRSESNALLGLESIFRQLHADGSCVLDIPECGSLYLRFSPVHSSSICGRMLPEPDETILNSWTDAVTSHSNEAPLIKSRGSKRWNCAFSSFQPDHLISDECVFVLIAPSYLSITEPAQWEPIDHVSRRILPYLDGVHCLPELAHLAKVDLTIARLCIVHLVRAGIVRALPAPTFLFPVSPRLDSTLSPITMAGWLGLPRLTLLLTEQELGNACLEAAIVPRKSTSTQISKAERCTLVHLFRVYAILCGSPHFSLPHLISAVPQLKFLDVDSDVNDQPSVFQSELFCEAAQVSLLRLVQFGEVNGLIHRLQCYPISDKHKRMSCDLFPTSEPLSYTTDHPKSRTTKPTPLSRTPTVSTPTVVSVDEHRWTQVHSAMDGLHSVGAIACIMARESGRVFRSVQSSFTEELSSYLYSVSSVNSSSPITTPPPHSLARRSSNHCLRSTEARFSSTAQIDYLHSGQAVRCVSSIGTHDSKLESMPTPSANATAVRSLHAAFNKHLNSDSPIVYFLWR